MTIARLAPISAKKLLRKLKKAGFVKLHQKGSHLTLKHPVSGKMVLCQCIRAIYPQGHSIIS